MGFGPVPSLVPDRELHARKLRVVLLEIEFVQIHYDSTDLVFLLRSGETRKENSSRTEAPAARTSRTPVWQSRTPTG